MTLIDAIRTLRKEKGMTFEQAKEVAILHFQATGRDIPATFDFMVKKVNQK
jgi:molybdenum cofactor biosynthesis enzyme